MAEKLTSEPHLEIGDKKVPLSTVNKPHYAVIDDIDKSIPNLQGFAPLEPLGADKKPKQTEKKD